MTLFTETVSTYPAVEVYGGLTACTNYLGQQMSPDATKFLGLVADDQKRCLIKATRAIEAQLWQGTANPSGNPGTVLSWPRTSVTDQYGNAVDSATVPTGIVNGCFEFAAILASNPKADTNPDADLRVASAGAGSDHVTFFRAPATRNQTGLPEAVRRLVGQYLGAVDSVSYGLSWGVSGDQDGDPDDESVFATDNEYIVSRQQ